MISILMPLFNGEEFLDDSISSIIHQTCRNWELLIGINGHTETKHRHITDRVSQYGDERIKTFSYTHKGKSRTLNELVSIAKYDYICLIDVDDLWMPTK